MTSNPFVQKYIAICENKPQINEAFSFVKENQLNPLPSSVAKFLYDSGFDSPNEAFKAMQEFYSDDKNSQKSFICAFANGHWQKPSRAENIANFLQTVKENLPELKIEELKMVQSFYDKFPQIPSNQVRPLGYLGLNKENQNNQQYNL
jgi:hypothetical protein